MPPSRRAPRAALAAVSAVAVLLAGCGPSEPEAASTTAAPSSSSSTTVGGSSTTSTTASTTTTVAGELVEISVMAGQVSGGPAEVGVAVGEAVTLRVTADVVEEVHVHGYDLTAELAPGVASEISFTADIPGVFEIELEESGLKIADLQVG